MLQVFRATKEPRVLQRDSGNKNSNGRTDMRTIKTITGVLAATGLLFAASSQAAVIMPGFNPDATACDFEDPGQNCWEVSPDGNADEPSLEDLANFVGVDPETVSLLFKQDVGGSESGSFGGSYSATFNNSPTDPAESDITYTGGDSISCGTCFLWVKDGNHDPYLYIFDISWWDGVEDLLLRNFWPTQGAISNVGIFGAEGGEIKVPEPGTLALLGMAVLGLGLVRRRRLA